ncbi:MULTISPECIES: hypothetical protein [unclassified Streptomyces]|uniref:hypothetical protein n=1 Tax=unclassified Streptomyces TaxID=2593676 RepID=UPI003820B058
MFVTAPVRTTVLPAIAEDSWDRITAIVLALLFDLTQQSARFGAAVDPWNQLWVYDVDGYAPFTTGDRA